MASTLRRIGLACAMLAFSGFALAQNLLVNPSFETAGQAGWTPLIVGGPAAWIDSATSPPTTDGVNGLTSSQLNPTSQILYQDVVLPSSGTYVIRAALGCSLGGTTRTDFCRVDVTNTNAATIAPTTPLSDTLATTNANVIAAVYANDGVAGAGPQAPIAATFTGTAGQTVRVRILVQASTDPVAIEADAFVLSFAGVQVPTLSQWSLMLLALLIALAAGLNLRRWAA